MRMSDKKWQPKVLGYYTIHGNLAVATCNPNTCYDFTHLEGDTVVVAGQDFKVKAVEKFMHCVPWHEGERIGLLLELTFQ
jgi:hypothetical protein